MNSSAKAPANSADEHADAPGAAGRVGRDQTAREEMVFVDGPEVAARSLFVRRARHHRHLSTRSAGRIRDGEPAAWVVAAAASPDTVDAQRLGGVPPRSVKQRQAAGRAQAFAFAGAPAFSCRTYHQFTRGTAMKSVE